MNKTERFDRSARRMKLLELLESIINGEIDSARAPSARIFNQKTPRERYISPKDRGGYNYGYMEVDEMLAGTPFYGEL